MNQGIWASIQDVFTAQGEQLNTLEMAARSLLVYVATLLLVRAGSKRFFGQSTAFDVLVSILLGSVMSRAINGTARFFPTVVAGGVLVGLHWLFAAMAFHSHHLGQFFKGHPRTLIKQGEMQWATMRQTSITEHDLREAARTSGKLTDLEEVQEAHLERSGNISIIQAKHPPRVLEVTVEDGVQTVRIQVE